MEKEKEEDEKVEEEEGGGEEEEEKDWNIFTKLKQKIYSKRANFNWNKVVTYLNTNDILFTVNQKHWQNRSKSVIQSSLKVFSKRAFVNAWSF